MPNPRKKDPVLLAVIGKARGQMTRVAKRAKLHPSHLRDIVSGRINNPRPQTLQKIAAATGQSLQQIEDYFAIRSGRGKQETLPLLGSASDNADTLPPIITQEPHTLEGRLLVQKLSEGALTPKQESSLWKTYLEITKL